VNIRVLSFKPGASNEYAFALNNNLVEKGIDVLMVCDTGFDIDNDFKAHFPIKKIFFFHKRNENITSKGIKYFYSILLLCFLLLKFRPHIIHIQWFKLIQIEYIIFKLTKMMGIKIVFTSHDVLPADHTQNVARFYGKIYRLSDFIIVHSDSTKSEIIDRFKIDSNKIIKIKHANFEFISEKYRYEKQQARKLLGLDINAKIMLFFGAIRDYKGFDILLEAFKKVRDEGNISNLKLIVAGGGRNKFYFVSREDLLYIQKNNDILYDDSFCDLDRMAQYFSASDISVMPYRKISASGILILSLAYGKPVIVSNVGGFPEYVINNQMGYIIPSNDKDALVIAIKKIFESENQIIVMGERCKEYSKNDLSWNICVEKTIDVYKKLLNE